MPKQKSFPQRQEQLQAEGQKFARLSDVQINQKIAQARMMSEKRGQKSGPTKQEKADRLILQPSQYRPDNGMDADLENYFICSICLSVVDEPQ